MKDKKLKYKMEKTFGWNPEDGDYSVAKERSGERKQRKNKLIDIKKLKETFKNLSK